jgi:hypothetical protein
MQKKTSKCISSPAAKKASKGYLTDTIDGHIFIDDKLYVEKHTLYSGTADVDTIKSTYPGKVERGRLKGTFTDTI